MKEKELLRNYKFREYLNYLEINRRVFKKLSDSEKAAIFKGFVNVTGLLKPKERKA